MLAQLDELRARAPDRRDQRRRAAPARRNLHDGAQQRLLAVSYDLRLARPPPRAAATGARALVSRAAEEVDGALGELRDLADGIYPAILTEAGLAAALESLADAAAIPVELGDIPRAVSGRRGGESAYHAAEEAIRDAAPTRGELRGVATSIGGRRPLGERRGRRRIPRRAAGARGRPGRRPRRLCGRRRANAIRAELPCG